MSSPINWGHAVAAGLVLGLGCQPAPASSGPVAPSLSPTPEASAPSAETATATTASAKPRSGPNDARGGRLYDNWRLEKGLGQSFEPDPSKTPALDGKGGPNGNGTLNDGAGNPIANSGHDYRLKNFFGWDLRGADGISGSSFQKRPYVLQRNLLADTRSPEELRAWFSAGDETLPAFGQVLDATDIEDLVAFLVKMQSGELARPTSIFALDAKAPEHYVLAAGGDAQRGRNRYAISCADCHGDDGRNMVIDETQSLGSLSRTSAYEVWFKMLNGQPGTDMHRQILDPSGAAQERAILDVLAALCDRRSFPAMPGTRDVPDGDPRCASYLE